MSRCSVALCLFRLHSIMALLTVRCTPGKRRDIVAESRALGTDALLDSLAVHQPKAYFVTRISKFSSYHVELLVYPNKIQINPSRRASILGSKQKTVRANSAADSALIQLTPHLKVTISIDDAMRCTLLPDRKCATLRLEFCSTNSEFKVSNQNVPRRYSPSFLSIRYSACVAAL